jgi:hypothetical protein
MTDAKLELKNELEQFNLEVVLHVDWVKNKTETRIETSAKAGMSSDEIRDCCPKLLRVLVADTLEKLAGREKMLHDTIAQAREQLMVSKES